MDTSDPTTTEGPYYLDDLEVGNYLDDLEVGQRFRSQTHTVTADEVKIFAYEFDPQPFHMNEMAARGTLFGGLAASGWHTAALTMRLLVTGGLPIAGGIVGRAAEVEWPRPTRPGDILRVETEVVAVTPSRSHPERGTVTFKVQTLNQKDQVVQEATMNLVVPRGRPSAAALRPTYSVKDLTVALGILIAIILSTCAFGPDYRKALVALGAFQSAGAVQARTAAVPTPPLDPWWSGFADPVQAPA